MWVWFLDDWFRFQLNYTPHPCTVPLADRCWISSPQQQRLALCGGGELSLAARNLRKRDDVKHVPNLDNQVLILQIPLFKEM